MAKWFNDVVRRMMTNLLLFLFLIFITDFGAAAAFKDVPPKVDPKAHYVFYLHGRIIEDQGIRPRHPQYGYYEYEQILQTLEQRSFVVISETRAKDTDPAQYASKVIKQIQSLLSSRVPASRVCVIGASKGGVIAMLVSAGLKNTKVRFVVMGSCNDSIEQTFHPNLSGEVLSIYEESDEIGHSCQEIFAHSSALKKTDEVQLHLGIAHGFLFRPIREWVDPSTKWCLRPDDD
jgi:hypothetical protein